MIIAPRAVLVVLSTAALVASLLFSFVLEAFFRKLESTHPMVPSDISVMFQTEASLLIILTAQPFGSSLRRTVLSLSSYNVALGLPLTISPQSPVFVGGTVPLGVAVGPELVEGPGVGV